MTPAGRDALQQLIEKWRKAATTAATLAAKADAEYDQAGNAHAFLKERRIWTTCAEGLTDVLARLGEREKETEEKDLSRVDSQPLADHGDLPRPTTGPFEGLRRK